MISLPCRRARVHFARLTLLGLLGAAAVYSQATPVILTDTLPAATVGTSYTANLSAVGGLPPYTWSSTGTMPPGLVVNASGSITGTPTTAGAYSITLRAADSKLLQGSKTLSLTVTGQPLTITTNSPLPAGTVGQSYNTVLAATGGTPPYQWAAGAALPAGLTLNATSGAISGIPTVNGTFTIPIQVRDAAQATVGKNLSITLQRAPLTITTVPPLFGGTVGSSYSQPFTAAGGVAPYNWSIASGSTDTLKLDAVSGVLQGTPQNAGTLTFTLRVTDSAGAAVTQSFSLIIELPALTITLGSPLPTGTVGVAMTQRVPVAASGGAPPYAWSVTAGAVPGLSFDAATISLTGTPTTAGSFNLTMQVRDSAGRTTTRVVAVTIAPATLTISTERQLADGRLNVPYSQALTVEGGRPPYTWSANGLPAGLAIGAASGVISGTPVEAGSFPVAITVADSGLTRFTDRFTIEITLPPAPGVTISGLPQVIGPAQQFPLRVSLTSAYAAPLTGQVILGFAPDTGAGDRTVQLSSGGTTASFQIAAGEMNALTEVPLALTTGTVSGTVSISLRLQAGGIDITPSPAPVMTAQIPRSAPNISSLDVSRAQNSIRIAIKGYSTTREITQAVFTFRAQSGQTLESAASSITVDVGSLFNGWFQDATNSQYGSQFVFTQPFTVQGDANAVIPVSVTLTNRLGSTTSTFTP